MLLDLVVVHDSLRDLRRHVAVLRAAPGFLRFSSKVGLHLSLELF